MDWFRTQWKSLQRGMDRWTGLGSVWRNTQGAFQQHAAYIKIGLVVLAFALALWLIWSVVFHFAQTFLMLRNINVILGWTFLVLVLGSIGWLAWFIRKTLRSVQNTKSSQSLHASSEDEKVDPTVAFLDSLPKPPNIGLLDILQPGARALMETLIFARDPASYEQALAQLERQEERDGRAPEWMLARAQILLHLGRQPQAYRIFSEVQQRYAKTRFAQDAGLLELAARLEFGHEAVVFSHESKASAPAPISAPAPAPAPAPILSTRLVQAPPPSEEDIFQNATVMTRPNLLRPEELRKMMQSPSSDHLPQADWHAATGALGTHLEEDSFTEDDLAAIDEVLVEQDLESALSGLPSAFVQEDMFSLQTMVKRPVLAPVRAEALLAPPSSSSAQQPELSAPQLRGALTPTPHVIEEEELSRHLPLLEEESFSDVELEKLSYSIGPTKKGAHTAKDAEISALLAEIDGPSTPMSRPTPPAARAPVPVAPVPVAPPTHRFEQDTQPNDAYSSSAKHAQGQAVGSSARQDLAAREALGRVEAEIETWLKKNPPALGGILLEDARRYEGILEEADHLREAGQRQKAHMLLRDILRISPASRYAKDAEMRLLSDKLFVDSND